MDGGISFSAAEIAVVGALLATVCGALSLLFRLLMAAKQEQLEDLRAENQRLREQVDRLLPLTRQSTNLTAEAVDLAKRLRGR